MKTDGLLHGAKRFAAIWLRIRVHLDAFGMFPARYLTALKWWVLGKRVRARGHFAPLLSQSPRAYEFWAASEVRQVIANAAAGTVEIIALVKAGGDAADQDATRRSLIGCGFKVISIPQSAECALASLAEHPNFVPGSWLMPVGAGDLIATHARQAYLSMIGQSDDSCAVIYADDDILDSWGGRKKPYFKPDWNPELHRHHDILTGACVVRADASAIKEAAREVDWDSTLVTAALKRGSVRHIDAVLHHRRSRPMAPKIVRPLAVIDNLPSASIIIPTRNRADLLRTCIKGLRATRYPDLEVIVANNDSDEPETIAYLETLAREGVTVLDQPGPFNYSTINNNAVAAARGELLCLMNNDIEVLSPDWLEMMATQAIRPDVGAVGAQLLYPDGQIQHAGVVVGVGNAAGHAHRYMKPEAEGYFRRHALPQFVSAVTGACLVVRRDRFLAVGGFDEQNFAVAFNDVDLCLRLNQRGWQSFYEPRAVLVHHESISRGFDTDPVGAARFAGELAALQRIWRTDEITDPYHHPMLSRASEQFVLDIMSMTARAQ